MFGIAREAENVVLCRAKECLLNGDVNRWRLLPVWCVGKTVPFVNECQRII